MALYHSHTMVEQTRALCAAALTYAWMPAPTMSAMSSIVSIQNRVPRRPRRASCGVYDPVNSDRRCET
jgi:hypothetical protein